MLKLREQKRAWIGGQEQSGLWVGGQKVWAKATGDGFPALSGEFIHYRQEDVTMNGVIPAHGQPLAMELKGEIRRKEVGGVDYFESSAGGLFVTRPTWGSDDGFSVWVLTDGARGDILFYIGPATYNATINMLLLRGDGSMMGVNNTQTFFDLPPPAGPETLCWTRPAIVNAKQGDISLRVDGVEIASKNGNGLGSPTKSNGESIMIGGRPRNGFQYLGARWRDIVIKKGGDFTVSEIADLQAYANNRKTSP